MKKIHIGYWYKESDPDTHQYPKPIPNSASEEQVKQMLFVLNNFIKVNSTLKHYKGISMCRVCGCMNHTGEYEKRYKKKDNPMVIFVVPEGLWHYVEKHKVLVLDLIQIYANIKP